jgi:chemotaxis signal transduction protein
MTRADTRIPLLTFRLATQYYALAVDNVLEVAVMVAVTQLPDTSSAFLGIANRHGEALPMLDLRHSFNLAAEAISTSTLFIVAESQNKRLGLIVDEIFQVKYIQEAAFDASHSAGRHISYIISDGERLYQQLDLISLMATYLSHIPN